MWFLQNTVDASFKLSLPVERDLVVGRKDCDLLIPDDKSISRKHALIRVQANEKSSPVYLTDCKSKFGSFLGPRRLCSAEKVILNEGNVVKFGQGASSGKFRLIFEPLVFCCSGMAGPDKLKVRQLAKSLGGHMVNNWSSECSHLVMTSLTVTIKVVCTLSSCKPIITPAWLEEAVRCFHDNKILPSPLQYQPAVVDDNVGNSGVSFKPNFARSSLFQDRVFYFLDEKQLSSLRLCVESAGACCKLINIPESITLETLVVKESIVIATKEEPKNEEERMWAELISNFLISHDLRAISESEIGFALLNVSINTYCNPRSKDAVPEVEVTLPPPSLSQMPLSMHTHTQHTQSHSHTSTQSKANVTILAPDTELNSYPPLKKSAVVYQSQSEILAPQSVEYNQPSQDTSIFAPSSLTPGSQSKSKGSGNTSLPGSSLMTQANVTILAPDTELNSQRSILSFPKLSSAQPQSSDITQSDSSIKIVDNIKLASVQVPETPSGAKSSIQLPETPSGAKSSIQLPETPSGAKSSAQNQKTKVTRVKVEASKTSRATKSNSNQKITSFFVEASGTKLTGTDTTPRSGSIEMDVLYDDIELSLAEVKSKLTTDREIKDEYPSGAEQNRSDFSKPVLEPEQEGPIATSTQAVTKASIKKPKIPVSPIGSDSPFISSRKRKRSLVDKSTSESSLANQTEQNFPTNEAAGQSDSMFVNTQSTQKTMGNKGLVTPFTSPFTCLSSSRREVARASVFAATGGRRSKPPVQTEADDLWNKEVQDVNGMGTEGENPLGTQYNEPGSAMFKPVLTVDGFIKARVKPKLQASRLGRFAHLAKSEFLTSPTGATPSDDVGGAKHDDHTRVYGRVEFVSLVRRGRDEEVVMEVEDLEDGSVKNFKKFRKVKNAGAGHVPTFLALTRYIPQTGTLLQDWDVTDVAERREGERENDEPRSQVANEDSQDIFNLSRVGRRRK